MVMRHRRPPGQMLEIGPGQGGIALLAREAGWAYSAIEPSAVLATQLRSRGFDVLEAFTPPIPVADASQDVLYADQVLEHMPGIDAARALVAEARRALRPGGLLFVVVPDYLKERGFFWDIDYTHNFITTERRVRQLLHDGGFEVLEMVRSIGLATGVLRDLLAGAVDADQFSWPRPAFALFGNGRAAVQGHGRTCSKRSRLSPVCRPPELYDSAENA